MEMVQNIKVNITIIENVQEKNKNDTSNNTTKFGYKIHHPNIQKAGAYIETQIIRNKQPTIVNIPNSDIRNIVIKKQIAHIKIKNKPQTSYKTKKKAIIMLIITQHNAIPDIIIVGNSIYSTFQC